MDVALPYKTIPVFRMSPADMIGEPGGYTQAYDMLGPAEAYNAQISMMLSNHSAYGMQKLGAPKGHGLKKVDLTGGINFFEYNLGMEPKPFQQLAPSPELTRGLDVWRREMETMSGVNAATRGDPSATKGDSGAKAALMHSATQQFNSGFQKSLAFAEEALYTHIIDTTKTHITDKRVATIAGKYNVAASKSYTGEDVEKVTRVRVKVGDPMLSTPEGRREFGQHLIELGAFEGPGGPERLIEFYVTGRYETLTEGPMAQVTLVRKENEALREGKPVPVVPTDKHIFHIEEHAEVMNDPEMRMSNPELHKAYQEHVQWHVECLTPGTRRFIGMATIQATGQKPLQGGEPQSPNPGGPPGGPQGGPPNKPSAPGQGGGGQLPQMPKGPKNPATGEQVDVSLPQPGNHVRPG
jgi:hypothetical protein